MIGSPEPAVTIVVAHVMLRGGGWRPRIGRPCRWMSRGGSSTATSRVGSAYDGSRSRRCTRAVGSSIGDAGPRRPGSPVTTRPMMVSIPSAPGTTRAAARPTTRESMRAPCRPLRARHVDRGPSPDGRVDHRNTRRPSSPSSTRSPVEYQSPARRDPRRTPSPSRSGAVPVAGPSPCRCGPGARRRRPRARCRPTQQPMGIGASPARARRSRTPCTG